jgi:hypothetical protein
VPRGAQVFQRDCRTQADLLQQRGLRRFNTEEEVDYVARRVIEAVRKLREQSPIEGGGRVGTKLFDPGTSQRAR